jgi:hypothetical protein
MKMGNVSFGGTAAIVTSVALIFGLDAATATKSTIVSGLLIVALADNLTDALSMHVYQEAERRLHSRDAFTATWSNFATRLLLALTFVALVPSLAARQRGHRFGGLGPLAARGAHLGPRPRAKGQLRDRAGQALRRGARGRPRQQRDRRFDHVEAPLTITVGCRRAGR